MADGTNDTGRAGYARHAAPDAHGRAAILLVESLIHGLIAQSVIRVEDAIEVVTIAIDAGMEIAADQGGHPDAEHGSIVILEAIRQSLSNDVL